MFKEKKEYITNKNKEFLKNSDLTVGWNKEADITLPANLQFALLLNRMAYVFNLIDDEIKKRDDYEDFLDIIKGVRIKQTLIDNNLTLPDIADILSKIDDAKKVSFLINEDDEEIIRYLISFAGCLGFDKIGLFFDELDTDYFNEFKLIEE
jgi:hypothetical protein